jgi:hypothetical protein
VYLSPATANYSGEAPLALPKLNLQFLSPSDYLLRNFHLFRLEAAYEVREDIQVRRQGTGRGGVFCVRVCVGAVLHMHQAWRRHS